MQMVNQTPPPPQPKKCNMSTPDSTGVINWINPKIQPVLTTQNSSGCKIKPGTGCKLSVVQIYIMVKQNFCTVFWQTEQT